MKNTMIVVLAACCLFVAFGCTAITSFDNPPVNKIDIGEEVGADVSVALDGDTGVVTLGFSSVLPVESADAIYALIGTEINLRVTNEENLVNVSLTDSPVEDTPSAPGEYQVVVADNNLDVTITFYNEASTGQMLRVDGNYMALLDVAENEWFETGAYSFDVTVE